MKTKYCYSRAYKTNEWHDNNLCDFQTILHATYIDNDVFFANLERAPWHVQAEINGHTINFYPHKMLAYADGFGTKETLHDIIDMIWEIKNAEEVELVE
jgi:hypothetical protein